MDLRSIYVFPVRDCGNGAGCAVGCGGAGQALITSGSKLLLFLVLPLFSLNGLLRSIGLSLPDSTAPLEAWNPTVVISAEIFGSCSVQGFWWTAESFDVCTRGCDDTTHPLRVIGVLIAAMLCTLPPLAVDSNEVAGEPKSFSGTVGGRGEGPKWRMTGEDLLRFRNQKYVKIAMMISSTATGIMASPAMDLDERPCFSCAGAADSVLTAGVVGWPVSIVFVAIVNCCDVDMVACCIRTVGKGECDDEVGCCGCWPRATSLVAVCDADRPSICTTRSIERIVVSGLHVTCCRVRHQRLTSCPLRKSMYSRCAPESFWNRANKDELTECSRNKDAQ